MNPPDPQTPTDALSALRAATASRLSELDAALPLSADEPGWAECAQHLHLLQTWLQPLEAWQAGFSDGPQDAGLLAPRWRAPRLLADLQHPLLAPWMSPLPDPAPAPWPGQATPAYRWGVAYVVEGAQLGGVLLYRRLAEALAPHPLSYLAGDGPATGQRWQQVARALHHAVRRRSDVAQACQGACDALDKLLTLNVEAAVLPVSAPAAAPAPAHRSPDACAS